MTSWGRERSQKLKGRFYSDGEHPYRIFESIVLKHAAPGMVVIDVGCGTEARVLERVIKRSGCFGIGIDWDVGNRHGREPALVRGDLHRLPVKSNSVDLVISRSVLEHLETPCLFFRELARVLKPEGKFIFLTPSRWDYSSVLARLIPNRFHGEVVRRTEGNTLHT